MRRRLLLWLVLAKGPVAAELVSSAEFPTVRIESGPFSLFEAMPVTYVRPIASNAVDDSPAERGGAAVDVPPADATRPSPTESEVGNAVRAAFRYDPFSEHAFGVKPELADGPIMIMAPFRVMGARDRDEANSIDAKERRDESELFDFTNGGRWAAGSLGKFQFELGLWKHDSRDPNATHLGPNDLIHHIW
jgi:hypothetical protein